VLLADARRRLASLPAPLPAPPAALRPVLLAGPGGEPGRLPAEPATPLREGAVLVLLYPGPEGDARVLLTERPIGELRHSGEVSFPGGAIEPADASAEDAALREAAEEVGLDGGRAGVEVVARLDTIEVRVSRFRLTPILAVAADAPVLQPDPREVASIVEAPLSAFVDESAIEIVEREFDGRRLRYGGYRVGRFHVWGATGLILGQLGAALAR
jgi:8-oxo-dGTP pyrophosphatase MutT (NUDIX family)